MSENSYQSSHLDVSLSDLDKITCSGSFSELCQDISQILENKIYGVCFSVYKDDQNPAKKSRIDAQQIRERLAVIKPYVQWIRTFSCTCGQELIPQIAHEMGFKTLVGAWLDADRGNNREEIDNLIDVVSKGYADIAAVGNEVLLRGDLSEEELIDYVLGVKKNAPQCPVGYVDSYYLFRDHPKVADACDLILANCYPFWEYCDLDHSIHYMKEMYRIAERAANGKKVIISETGWPSSGTNCGDAIPSLENMGQYFVSTFQWSSEENVNIFYFTSFDEAWKVSQEGDCGAHWGLWKNDGVFKFEISK